MNTKIKVAEVKITLSYDQNSPCILSVSSPKGIKGDDIYFSEHDGVKVSDLFPAFMHHLPAGATIESNGIDEAWVAYWDDDALTSFDGCTFVVRFVQVFEVDANGNTLWVQNSSYAY